MFALFFIVQILGARPDPRVHSANRNPKDNFKVRK